MDRTQVVPVSERLTTPAGTFERCLKTEETTRLEPGGRQHALDTPAVGLITHRPLILISRRPV